MEHILPDNLFASPAAVGDHVNVFSTASAQVNESTPISSSSNSNSNSNSNNNNNLLPTTSTSTSTSNATSPKSVLSSPGTIYFFPCITSKPHAQKSHYSIVTIVVHCQDKLLIVNFIGFLLGMEPLECN